MFNGKTPLMAPNKSLWNQESQSFPTLIQVVYGDKTYGTSVQ